MIPSKQIKHACLEGKKMNETKNVVWQQNINKIFYATKTKYFMWEKQLKQVFMPVKQIKAILCHKIIYKYINHISSQK